MIQCGGFTTEMAQKKTKAEIKNEADNGLKNLRGSLAMARTQIVDSASIKAKIRMVMAMLSLGRLLRGWMLLMKLLK